MNIRGILCGKKVCVFNIFKGDKWYEDVLFFLAIPFIVIAEIWDEKKPKRKRK
jgi:hypothetical protein